MFYSSINTDIGSACCVYFMVVVFIFKRRHYGRVSCLSNRRDKDFRARLTKNTRGGSAGDFWVETGQVVRRRTLLGPPPTIAGFAQQLKHLYYSPNAAIFQLAHLGVFRHTIGLTWRCKRCAHSRLIFLRCSTIWFSLTVLV